jgi:hypothetical protein
MLFRDLLRDFGHDRTECLQWQFGRWCLRAPLYWRKQATAGTKNFLLQQ